MKLKSFEVTKFRNIVDSGSVNVDQSVTCLVGKNEAGKSGLLEALYLLNPAYGEKFHLNDQYPRWLQAPDRRATDLKEVAPVRAIFDLDDADAEGVALALGPGVLTGRTLTLARKYGDGRTWVFKWDEKAAIKNLVKRFPGSLRSSMRDCKTLASLRETLASTVPGESVSPEDLTQAHDALRETVPKEEWDIWRMIVEVLRPRVPTFFRFTNYSTLPGRIDFGTLSGKEEEDGPARSGLQTARALLKLAGTNINQLGSEDYELRRGELETVQIDLTNQVFAYWKQNPHLEVNIDVDKETHKQDDGKHAVARFLDIRLKDRRSGYSNNFSQRSSGFQWFFSFLAAFSEFEGKENSTIVLLDEPALSLHGKAQADFLRFINDRLGKASQVIYTTHSPFMVEFGHVDRVRIVEDNGPPAGAVVRDDVFASDPDSLFPLQAALGYDIAQSLFVGPNNLVVEGTSDLGTSRSWDNSAREPDGNASMIAGAYFRQVERRTCQLSLVSWGHTST